MLRHVTSSLQAVKSLFEPYCCDVVGEFDDVTWEPGDRQRMLWARRALRTCLCGALVLRVPEREVWPWILTIFCQSESHRSSCTGSVFSPSEESLQIKVSMIMRSFQRLAICLFWLSGNWAEWRQSKHPFIHFPKHLRCDYFSILDHKHLLITHLYIKYVWCLIFIPRNGLLHLYVNLCLHRCTFIQLQNNRSICFE